MTVNHIASKPGCRDPARFDLLQERGRGMLPEQRPGAGVESVHLLLEANMTMA